MSKKVVISADDFGLSRAYDLGAVRAYSEGVATVLSLIVNTSEAPDAVELRDRCCPGAPLALHLNLCMGSPVSDPQSIPTLVDDEGRLCRSSEWSPKAVGDPKCRGTLDPSLEDILRETRALVSRFVELTGARPNRIESHSVVTRRVLEALAIVGRELGVHTEAIKGEALEGMRSCGECLPEGGIAEKLALTARGSRPEDWERDAYGILGCPYEIAILHFHPGYVDQFVIDHSSLVLPRCRDLETLTDPRVRAWLKNNGVEPVSYGAIYR